MGVSAGPARTRRERVEEREEAILDAAHDEFVRHGFAGAKMAEIARRAGVAEGTVYLYFKSKDALLFAVVGRFYERLTQGTAEGIRGIEGSYAKLEFIARHHIESCLADWRILELLMAQYRHLPDYESGVAYKYNRAYVAVFDGVIRDAVNREEIRRSIPHYVIRDLFFGALEHAMRTHMLKGASAGDVEMIASTIVDILRRGIGIESGAPARRNGLSSVVERLEKVAARLEEAASS